MAIGTKQTQWEAIPPSKVVVSFPATDLPSLPPGAGYHAKEGRAAVDIRRNGDTIEVTASCDSLQRQVEYWQDMYYQTKSTVDRQGEEIETLKQPRASPVKTALKWLFTGILTGAISTIIIIKKIKKHGR